MRSRKRFTTPHQQQPGMAWRLAGASTSTSSLDHRGSEAVEGTPDCQTRGRKAIGSSLRLPLRATAALRGRHCGSETVSWETRATHRWAFPVSGWARPAMIFTGAYHFRNPGSHVWVCLSSPQLLRAPQVFRASGPQGLLLWALTHSPCSITIPAPGHCGEPDLVSRRGQASRASSDWPPARSRKDISRSGE